MVVNITNQTEPGRPVITPPQVSKDSSGGQIQQTGQPVPIGEGTGKQGANSLGLNSEQLQEELQRAIKETNSALEVRNISLAYSVDQTTEEIVVKVIDKSTDKLIRQIPPESVIKFRGRMKELLGVIFDENG